MNSWTTQDAQVRTWDSSTQLTLRGFESDLIDLADWSLEDLRVSDGELLSRSLDRQLRQVHRPRGNFVDDSPPDRVD